MGRLSETITIGIATLVVTLFVFFQQRVELSVERSLSVTNAFVASHAYQTLSIFARSIEPTIRKEGELLSETVKNSNVINQEALTAYRENVLDHYKAAANKADNIPALVGELLAMNEILYECGDYKLSYANGITEYFDPSFCDREALRKIYVAKFSNIFLYVRLSVYCDESMLKDYGPLGIGNRESESPIEKTEAILKDYYEIEENALVLTYRTTEKIQMQLSERPTVVLRPTACETTWNKVLSSQ